MRIMRIHDKRLGWINVTRRLVGDMLYIHAEALKVTFEDIKVKLFFNRDMNVVTIMNLSGIFFSYSDSWEDCFLNRGIIPKFEFKDELLYIINASIGPSFVQLYKPDSTIHDAILLEIAHQKTEVLDALKVNFNADISEKIMGHFVQNNLKELLVA